MPDEAITAVAGLLASFLSGLLGIGGGLVLTPLLLYLPPLLGGVPIPVKIVTGLTIVQAISGSLLGTIRHSAYGNVSVRLVWLMGPFSAISSLAGALVSRDTPDRVILLVFAALALAGAVMLLLPVTPREGDARSVTVRRPLAVGIALVLGFFGGIVGIGGIAFLTAALVYLLRIPPRVQSAISPSTQSQANLPEPVRTGGAEVRLGACLRSAGHDADCLDARVAERSVQSP